MVRARTHQHLVRLRRLVPGLPAILPKGRFTDYPWRIIVSVAEKDEIICVLSEDIDYTNFKDAAAVVCKRDKGYLTWLHEVWLGGVQMVEDSTLMRQRRERSSRHIGMPMREVIENSVPEHKRRRVRR